MFNSFDIFFQGRLEPKTSKSPQTKQRRSSKDSLASPEKSEMPAWLASRFKEMEPKDLYTLQRSILRATITYFFRASSLVFSKILAVSLKQSSSRTKKIVIQYLPSFLVSKETFNSRVFFYFILLLLPYFSKIKFQTTLAKLHFAAQITTYLESNWNTLPSASSYQLSKRNLYLYTWAAISQNTHFCKLVGVPDEWRFVA